MGTQTKMKEIAEQLELSVGTVSIVLNGRGDAMRISKETQKRVWDTAKNLNYQPNIYARRLRKAGSEDASIVVAVFWNVDYMDEMMGNFFRGAYQSMTESGRNIEFNVQLYEYDNLSKHQGIMNANRFSGIIVGGASDKDVEFLNENHFDLPLVLMGRKEQNYHCVSVNGYEVGQSTARLFHLRGHQKVGLMTVRRRPYGTALRQQGFLEECRKRGLRVEDRWIREGENRDFRSGYEEAKQMLQGEERPTAIFAMSANQALGVAIACRDMGLRVPEDVELITFGDNEALPFFLPSISAVHTPGSAMAEAALELLVSALDNEDEPICRVLESEYCFRESCGGFPEEA